MFACGFNVKHPPDFFACGVYEIVLNVVGKLKLFFVL